MAKKKRENAEYDGISIQNDIWTLDEDAISRLFTKKEDIPPAEPGMVQRVVKEEVKEPEFKEEPEVRDEPEMTEEEPQDVYSMTSEEKEQHKEELKKEINAKFSRKKTPVLEGPDGDIELKKIPCVIGRKGDYMIKGDTYISLRHCRITEDNGHYYIEDLKSTNGTFVDGDEIAEKTEIFDYQEILLADRPYTFRLR